MHDPGFIDTTDQGQIFQEKVHIPHSLKSQSARHYVYVTHDRTCGKRDSGNRDRFLPVLRRTQIDQQFLLHISGRNWPR